MHIRCSGRELYKAVIYSGSKGIVRGRWLMDMQKVGAHEGHVINGMIDKLTNWNGELNRRCK